MLSFLLLPPQVFQWIDLYSLMVIIYSSKEVGFDHWQMGPLWMMHCCL
jgi:hypothetical protein